MDNKNKTFKLCLDGKKINASTSGSGGDVDLFGFEPSPTLAERQNRLKNEIDTVKEAELPSVNILKIHFLEQVFFVRRFDTLYSC